MQKKKMKLWKKIVIGIVAVILILLIAAFFIIRNMFSQPDIESAKGTDETIVQTDKGAVMGSLEDGIFQYLGIPYAAAKERFTLADEVEPWDGTFEATKVGAMSPQSGMLGMSAGSQEGTDNNCQNLNVWTPGIHDGEKRAVMVWLHGGGFSTGTANSEQYNGKDLSKSGDVVVVSVNHRLGASGFLDLSAYGEKYQYSANAGLDDIVKALEWIHENIAEFGGDPENVTVFGQSGGGAKVLALMTTPNAKGLFQRGIVQSGATETMGVTFTGKEASQSLTEHILDKLGITAENIEDIQNVDISKLEKTSQEAMQETAEEYQIPAPLSDGYAMEWGPVIDGDYMPENPVTGDSFAENGKDIDLLIGSNLNEWTTMMGGDQGTLTDEEVAAYKSAYPDKNPENANKVDTLIRIPMLKIMSHKANQGGANVYAYVFTWENGANDGRGSYHGAEISYVFDHAQQNQTAQKFADQVSQAWVNFAKTGVPSADGLPEWEPYDNENGATMILDEKSTLVYGHDRELMKLLENYSVEDDLQGVNTDEQGTEKYKGFVLDNILHSENDGDIHYHVYVPDAYDGSEPYALFLTLPGYQGLYFQGVGQNLYTEDFGFVAQDYNPKMIVVAPQLDDWGDTSAKQTIALTEYFLVVYNIDRSKVYAEGYSGGGETLSRVMGMRPDLYTAYLQCSSQWDGGYDAVVKSRTPVYFVVGENDEYYGSDPSSQAYNEIYKLYEKEGLSDSEIDQLLVLDIKPSSYFTSRGITNQHGAGGALFVQDKDIMGWLFGQQKVES